MGLAPVSLVGKVISQLINCLQLINQPLGTSMTEVYKQEVGL